MSGRIYDSGVSYGSGLSDLPTCDKCGADMWKSSENNFYGTICIIKNCGGKPIYGKEIVLGGEKFLEKEIVLGGEKFLEKRRRIYFSR